MHATRTIAAMLLALPLIVLGSNKFFNLFEIKQEGESEGHLLLQAINDGNLMYPIALSHVFVGIALLIPKTRFAAALLQLPITLGIVSFHITMLPEGVAIAASLLLLNLLTLSDQKRLESLFD